MVTTLNLRSQLQRLLELTTFVLLTLLLPVNAFATCNPFCPAPPPFFPVPPPSVWLMHGGDETNANFNRNETTLNWTNIQSAIIKWSAYPLSGASWPFVTVSTDGGDILFTADGTLFLTAPTSAAIKLLAVDTGAKPWTLW